MLDLDYSNDSLEARYARSTILVKTFAERRKTLKACPFCAGEPRITDSYWAAGGTYMDHQVVCTSCGVTATKGRFVGDPDAVEVWNRRA